jgi:hypothetical protein
MEANVHADYVRVLSEGYHRRDTIGGIPIAIEREQSREKMNGDLPRSSPLPLVSSTEARQRVWGPEAAVAGLVALDVGCHLRHSAARAAASGQAITAAASWDLVLGTHLPTQIADAAREEDGA